MADDILQTLIVRLKAEGAKETQGAVDKTKKSTQRTGVEMSKVSKKFGLAFKAAGLFAVGLFASILKGGPVTAVFLAQTWRAIGLLGDTILEKAGAWELLSSVTDGLFELNDIMANTTIIESFVETLGFLAPALTVTALAILGPAGLMKALTILAAHPIIAVIAGFVILLTLMNDRWKQLHGGVSIFASAMDGANKAVSDFAEFILTGRIPENWNTIWTKVERRFGKSAKIIRTVASLLFKGIKFMLAPFRLTWFVVITTIRGKWTEEIGKIKSTVINALNAMKSALIRTINFFRENPVVRSIKSAVSSVIHRQAGGAAIAGRPHIVGEDGPELFTPASSGGITPNHALGGLGGGDLTANIIIEMDGRTLWDGVKRFAASDIKRGGGF